MSANSITHLIVVVANTFYAKLQIWEINPFVLFHFHHPRFRFVVDIYFVFLNHGSKNSGLGQSETINYVRLTGHIDLLRFHEKERNNLDIYFYLVKTKWMNEIIMVTNMILFQIEIYWNFKSFYKHFRKFWFVSFKTIMKRMKNHKISHIRQLYHYMLHMWFGH